MGKSCEACSGRVSSPSIPTVSLALRAGVTLTTVDARVLKFFFNTSANKSSDHFRMVEIQDVKIFENILSDRYLITKVAIL